MSRTEGKPTIEIVYDTVNFKQTDFDEYTREFCTGGLGEGGHHGGIGLLLGKGSLGRGGLW